MGKGKETGFEAIVQEDGTRIFEVVPGSVVAVVSDVFVEVRSKHPLNDDPYDYHSVFLTIEQFKLLAKSL